MNLYNFLFFFLIGSPQLFGQLVCTPEDPEFLVQDILAGYGIVTYDYSSSGAVGYFTSTNTMLEDSLGISSGVIITTGDLSNLDGPIGPNDDLDAGMDNGEPGDVAMSMSYMLNRPTYNAGVLRFKAYSLSDSILIRYVFGSESYPEDISGSYSDGMAIFIDDGVEYCAFNFAKVPSPNSPGSFVNLTTQTVNSGANSELYINNMGTAQSNSDYYVQYNGFTKVLEAKVAVIPNHEYEIAIVVVDVDDAFWDSGVFLVSNSMTASNMELSSNQFSISPNPASDFLNVTIEDQTFNSSWKIVDQQGRDILTGDSLVNKSINVSELKPGNYFFILNGTSSSVRTFQKW